MFDKLWIEEVRGHSLVISYALRYHEVHNNATSDNHLGALDGKPLDYIDQVLIASAKFRQRQFDNLLMTINGNGRLELQGGFRIHDYNIVWGKGYQYII